LPIRFTSASSAEAISSGVTRRPSGCRATSASSGSLTSSSV
jgi:hypothetical protein